jgi:hypothetical protein
MARKGAFCEDDRLLLQWSVPVAELIDFGKVLPQERRDASVTFILSDVFQFVSDKLWILQTTLQDENAVADSQPFGVRRYKFKGDGRCAKILLLRQGYIGHTQNADGFKPFHAGASRHRLSFRSKNKALVIAEYELFLLLRPGRSPGQHLLENMLRDELFHCV